MYNLKSSMADRIRFDDMAAIAAEDILQSLGAETIASLDDEFVTNAWEQVSDSLETDDEAEAEARFRSIMTAKLHAAQKSND